MQRKPNTICRNYIFWGHCGDWHCNRAHVPHHLMVRSAFAQFCSPSYDPSQLDLFIYLLEQDDCPLELRSLRGRFTSPKPVCVLAVLGFVVGLNKSRDRAEEYIRLIEFVLNSSNAMVFVGKTDALTLTSDASRFTMLCYHLRRCVIFAPLSFSHLTR